MKKIFNYFTPKQELSFFDNIKTKFLISIIFVGLLIILVSVIQELIFIERSKASIISIASSVITGLFLIISLVILRKKGVQLAGNIISLGLVIILLITMNILQKDVSAMYKYIDGFYVILALLSLGVLYASRYILIINAILILASTIRIFLFAIAYSPENEEYFRFGLISHTVALVIITAVLYFEKSFATRAIKKANKETHEKELQNQDLKTSEEEIRASMEELKTTTDALEESYGELSIAKEKAEESDRLKSVFLTNMSHEIRTPLNGIIGFSNLLKSQEHATKKCKYYTDVITKSSNQLLKIIDDIIEISQLETGQVNINTSKVNLNYVILNLVEEFKYSSDKKGINLLVETNLTDDESNIYTDEPKLLKILTNLIENAIKFTKKGFVKIKYKLNGQTLEFFIEDTGIGFEQGKTYNIFDRFVQANEEISIDFGGLGLGLTIAKLNTELLGGKINAESELGKGATFHFNIPYKLAILKKEITEKEEKVKKNAQIKECKILIVEDEEINFLFIKEILSQINIKCNILEATNGQEAVDIFTNNPDIDLVLMDLKMPVMDGYQATKIIKKLKPEVPIVIQTAYTLEEERKKSKSAGCDDFITKPIRIKEFKEVLSRNLKL
ncbi:MAG: response regulator [Bacteroidota bacterium]